MFAGLNVHPQLVYTVPSTYLLSMVQWFVRKPPTILKQRWGIGSVKHTALVITAFKLPWSAYICISDSCSVRHKTLVYYFRKSSMVSLYLYHRHLFSKIYCYFISFPLKLHGLLIHASQTVALWDLHINSIKFSWPAYLSWCMYLSFYWVKERPAMTSHIIDHKSKFILRSSFTVLTAYSTILHFTGYTSQ